MKKNLALISVVITSIIIVFHSCKKEKAEGIDKQLYNMAQETDGFVWYKNTNSLLNKSAGSGHSELFLRTRYNATAATQLDADFKVIDGTTFPEGSLIVKELYSNSSTLSKYAVLYKQTANENADVNGWVWGYINADGTVAESATNKGTSCTSCHSQSNHIDYTLMNKYFP